MTNAEARAALYAALAEQTTKLAPELSTNPEYTLLDDLGIDSLGVTEIAVNLEDQLGVEINQGDYEGLTTVGDFVRMIDAKVVD